LEVVRSDVHAVIEIKAVRGEAFVSGMEFLRSRGAEIKNGLRCYEREKGDLEIAPPWIKSWSPASICRNVSAL
jgi:hypothetical protein